MNQILIFVGSVVIVVWGIGHLAATKSVISGFSSVSLDNRRVITMEWISEGLTLCFVGAVATVATLVGGSTGGVVLWACVGLLVLMAILSLFTGARTSVIPMRVCPIVKSGVATLYALGNLMS
jgi:hypothetical protein